MSCRVGIPPVCGSGRLRQTPQWASHSKDSQKPPRVEPASEGRVFCKLQLLGCCSGMQIKLPEFRNNPDYCCHLSCLALKVVDLSSWLEELLFLSREPEERTLHPDESQELLSAGWFWDPKWRFPTKNLALSPC